MGVGENIKVMGMTDKKEWFKLSRCKVMTLSAYFLLLIIMSMCIILSLFIVELNIYYNVSTLTQSIIGSMSTAALGGSIYYFRKVYKACINLDLSFPESDYDKIREMGVFLYFFLRPLYAICFSVIMIIFLKSGMSFMVEETKLNDRFIYISMLLSFFVGYSAGDLIDTLERKGKEIVESITNKR